MSMEPYIRLSIETAAGWSASGKTACIVESSGSGPDFMHIHHDDDEAWHVLEGTLLFHFIDKEVEANAGTTVFVPAGVAHTYIEKVPSRYLLIMTPNLQSLIDELHATGFSDVRATLAKYNTDIVDPR